MKESHAISVRPCIIWSYPLFTQINRKCFGPAVLILASSVVLTLGRCILTVSCTRLLGNPSNLFSCPFLSDFLGSPVPYILNFWACPIQSVITFSPMCISGQFRRFYSPVFSQPHSHAWQMPLNKYLMNERANTPGNTISIPYPTMLGLEAWLSQLPGIFLGVHCFLSVPDRGDEEEVSFTTHPCKSCTSLERGIKGRALSSLL